MLRTTRITNKIEGEHFVVDVDLSFMNAIGFFIKSVEVLVFNLIHGDLKFEILQWS